MKLVGSLLWIARMSYDELAFGISQLCSVMSKPSEKAWIAALDMLKWLVENKECGACCDKRLRALETQAPSGTKRPRLP